MTAHKFESSDEMDGGTGRGRPPVEHLPLLTRDHSEDRRLRPFPLTRRSLHHRQGFSSQPRHAHVAAPHWLRRRL